MKALRGAYLRLVEDNAVNQEVALDILVEVGIRVDVANNGAEAVEKVLQADYDGVLMDCQMPVMDGFDATRKIRVDTRFTHLPILAMTANAMAGDKEKCIECGMNDHIAKPVDIGRLFISLGCWIRPKAVASESGAESNIAKAVKDDEVPYIVGLETDKALKRVGGSAKLLRKLLNRFSETQADAMTRIKTAVENNDTEIATPVKRHTVKGLAGNIGALKMAKCAGLVRVHVETGRILWSDTGFECDGAGAVYPARADSRCDGNSPDHGSCTGGWRFREYGCAHPRVAAACRTAGG